MGEIKWNKKALKQLMRIPVNLRKPITDAVDDLLVDSRRKNIKPLQKHRYGYRLRVGRYRVFFDIDQKEVKIYLIQEVKKRDERTY